LEVQKYLETKARPYHRGKASTVYIVKQDSRVLAFFTLSMAGLESKELPESDKLVDYNARYPAVLLGQMGVDKSCRRQGLGELICNYCIGLAEKSSEQIACRYIILQTSQAKVEFYREKCGFQQSVKANPNGKFWMYRRLSLEIVNVIIENLVIGEFVNVVKGKGDKEQGQ
jgi:GNAT superfamily N-acetyltransferase